MTSPEADQIRAALHNTIAERMRIRPGWAPTADELHAARPEGRQIMKRAIASVHTNLIRAALAARDDQDLIDTFDATRSWTMTSPAGDWTTITIGGRVAFEIEPFQSFAETVNIRWTNTDDEIVEHTLEVLDR